MILLDTSGIVASYDRGERFHTAVVRILTPPEDRILSPFVLAEVDYFVTKIGGQAAELRMLEDVVQGAYRLEPFSAADIAAAKSVIERYRDLDLGLADASIVVLAERYRCWDILTLDLRHFRALRDSAGRPFRLLPHDIR